VVPSTPTLTVTRWPFTYRLSQAAILEAQVLMLSAHNMLNPQNGTPITLPSQDMVLGLYYITKERRSTESIKVKGEGMRFYSPEEVMIAYNEGNWTCTRY
jgi:DNA-directed RNA polymerase subunit beta'